MKTIFQILILFIFVSCTGGGGSSSDSGGSNSATDSGAATSKPSFSVDDYDFGLMGDGITSQEQEIQIENNNSTALEAFQSIIITGGNADQFEIVFNNCLSVILRPGESCTITITAKPNTGSGTKEAAVQIQTGDDIAELPVSVDVSNDQAPTVGADQNETVNEDTPLTLTLNPATSNEGNPLSYSLVNQPESGTLTDCLDLSGSDNAQDLSCSYTPNGNYNGSDSFTYKANDGLDSNIATITITINSVLDAPTMGADQAESLSEDNALELSLNPATSIEGAALSYSLITSPSNGTLTNCLTEAGSDNAQDLTCTYTPNADYHGSDSFTYRANDGLDASSVGTVTLTINPVADAPTVGANQTESVAVDTPLAFTVNSATTSDPYPLVYSAITLPTNGTLTNCMGETGSTGDNDLSCTYTPNSSYIGSDSFTYRVSNGEDSELATVNLNVVVSDLELTISLAGAGESFGFTLLTTQDNIEINWGDGQTSTVTYSSNADRVHTYTSAGTYTVTVSGKLGFLRFDSGSGSVAKITSVAQLGALGYQNLGTSFQNATNLVSFSGAGDTSGVTSMGSMFYGATALTTADFTHFDTSSVTTMNAMFHSASSLTTLDLSGFDTSSVTNMVSMFQNMTSLTSLDLSDWDTSAVTSMSTMFRQTSNLETLDLSSFDTSSVTNLSWMFYLSDVSSLDLGNFNTSSVTDMRSMFRSTYNLTSVNVSSFDTSSVTRMDYMFSYANALTTLNVSNFDTTSVTHMDYMFNGLSSLSVLDLSAFDTTSVTSMRQMFISSSGITSLDLNGWDVSNVTESTGIFTSMTGAIYCDQGGSAGTGTIFGVACN